MEGKGWIWKTLYTFYYHFMFCPSNFKVNFRLCWGFVRKVADESVNRILLERFFFLNFEFKVHKIGVSCSNKYGGTKSYKIIFRNIYACMRKMMVLLWRSVHREWWMIWRFLGPFTPSVSANAATTLWWR